MNPLLIKWLFASVETRLQKEFEAIWKSYPKKVQRGKGLAAYIATRRKGTGFRVLLTAARSYSLAQKDEDSTFTLHAGTFFGPSEGWKDFDGKGTDNGHKRNRKDGRWEPPMRDLTENHQETNGTQATDPNPTKDPEDILKESGL